MKKLLEILIQGILIVAVILYFVWDHYAPARAQQAARQEAQQEAYSVVKEICSRAAHDAIVAAEESRTPHFVGVDVQVQSKGGYREIRDGEYVVTVSAYVLTLAQPNSSFREPSNILSCRIRNGQLVDSQWIK